MTAVSNYAAHVPLDATPTRAKIMDAGERLFAEHGIHGAQLRDIVRAAGQANDSAIHYHFGSRTGLLAAICDRHVGEMEPERRRRRLARAAAPTLDELVDDLVAPTAGRLSTQEGRYFLRIIVQLAGRSGARAGAVNAALSGVELRGQLAELEHMTAKIVPLRTARERVAVVIGALTAALAQRAEATDTGERLVLSQRAFVANLDAMLSAALRA